MRQLFPEFACVSDGVPLPLRRLLALTGVTWWKLDLLFGLDSGLELAAALYFGVNSAPNRRARLAIHSHSRKTMTPASEP